MSTNSRPPAAEVGGSATCQTTDRFPFPSYSPPGKRKRATLPRQRLVNFAPAEDRALRARNPSTDWACTAQHGRRTSRFSGQAALRV